MAQPAAGSEVGKYFVAMASLVIAVLVRVIFNVVFVVRPACSLVKVEVGYLCLVVLSSSQVII